MHKTPDRGPNEKVHIDPEKRPEEFCESYAQLDETVF